MTERGSPDQAYPKTKSNFFVDWNWNEWGASGAIRYVSSVNEVNVTNKLSERAYVDAQVRWTPHLWDDAFQVALGVNNLFDKDPPGCISCSLNNYDPNIYDAPGRLLYLRLSYKQ